jgi:hypothetical protein
MVTKPSVRIEDGFDKPITIPSNGTVERENRKPEPVRTSPIDGDIPTISPFDFEPGDDTRNVSGDDQPRKRGRPFGSRNKPRTEESQKESHLSANLDGLLLSAHFAVAAFLETPELEINQVQAKQYAESLKEVMKHYQTVVDPKKLAWAQLIFVMGGIYGPMFPAIRDRKSKTPVVAKPTVTKSPEAPTPIDRNKQERPKTSGRSWAEMSPSEINPQPPGETVESF